MKVNGFEIRVVSPEDAKKLLEIYAYYVKNTAISFDIEVPTEEEFKIKIENTLKRYPFIAAYKGDEISGYAYLSPFVGRKAYEKSAETTIYLKPDEKKKGIGKTLYNLLEETARQQNINNLYSCIGYPEKEDEYLSMNSVEFHSHMGYRLVGKFNNCGYKFGRYYSMVWMEKILQEPGEHREIKNFDKTDIYEKVRL